MARSKSNPINTASARAPDWQAVENVVAAIERAAGSVVGMTVTQKAQLPRLLDSTDFRDVDVLVEVPAGPRNLRVAIEVKNRSRPLSIDQMGCLVDLRRDISVDRFCVYSASGFSEGARRKATENNIEMVTLQEFQSSEFWSCPPAIRVVRTGGQIISAQFIFDPATMESDGDRIQKLLSAGGIDDVSLVNHTGTALLRTFLSAHLHDLAESNPAFQVEGQVVELRVDARSRETEFRVREEVLPPPTFIIVKAKIERKVDVVPQRRFRQGDVELETSEIELFGSNRQVTLLAERLSTGERQLKFVVGPARPEPRRKGD